jgi:hypothetical protein
VQPRSRLCTAGGAPHAPSPGTSDASPGASSDASSGTPGAGKPAADPRRAAG